MWRRRQLTSPWRSSNRLRRVAESGHKLQRQGVALCKWLSYNVSAVGVWDIEAPALLACLSVPRFWADTAHGALVTGLFPILDSFLYFSSFLLPFRVMLHRQLATCAIMLGIQLFHLSSELQSQDGGGLASWNPSWRHPLNICRTRVHNWGKKNTVLWLANLLVKEIADCPMTVQDLYWVQGSDEEYREAVCMTHSHPWGLFTDFAWILSMQKHGTPSCLLWNVATPPLPGRLLGLIAWRTGGRWLLLVTDVIVDRLKRGN